MFSLLSTAIYLSHYHWLDHLSLWGNLGWKQAPSIGLTRAYWLLLHGNAVAAWHRNWLIYAVLAVGLPIILKDVYNTLMLIRKKEINNGQPTTN